jgi:hypothetical protein
MTLSTDDKQWIHRTILETVRNSDAIKQQSIDQTASAINNQTSYNENRLNAEIFELRQTMVQLQTELTLLQQNSQKNNLSELESSDTTKAKIDKLSARLSSLEKQLAKS